MPLVFSLWIIYEFYQQTKCKATACKKLACSDLTWYPALYTLVQTCVLEKHDYNIKNG